MTEAAPSRPGLRERKRARTYETIQRTAVDLFLTKGYAATTVEEIAEAADVSPSTVFRYFPTKLDLVVTDEWDELFIASLRRQPAELEIADAFRTAAHETFSAIDEADRDLLRRRAHLMTQTPEMRAASLKQIIDSADLVTEIVVERTAHRHEDLEALRAEAHTFALALVGIVAGAALSALDVQPYDVPEIWWDQVADGIEKLQEGFHL